MVVRLAKFLSYCYSMLIRFVVLTNLSRDPPGPVSPSLRRDVNVGVSVLKAHLRALLWAGHSTNTCLIVRRLVSPHSSHNGGGSPVIR